MAKKEIACAINPACGNDAFVGMKATEKPLNIAIVGGGPAGMEAARIATVRGHKAKLFEKSGELGGAILGCCMVPGKEKMKWYADWIRSQIKKLEVDVQLGHAPDAEELKNYDLVLNATGASSYVPQVIGAANVVRFEDVIVCPKTTCEYHPGNRKNIKVGDRVIVWGDHYAAVDTATFLASIGKQVTIVTKKKEFASSVEVIHMYVQRKRFSQTDAEGLHSKPYEHPVKIVECATIYEIREGEVTLQDNQFNHWTIPADTVVTCHLRPNTSLYDELLQQGVTVMNVGDSVRPRNLHAAVREGAAVGLNLDEHMLLNSNNAIMNELPIDVLGQLRH